AMTYAGTTNGERNQAAGVSYLNGLLGITRQTGTGGTLEFIRDPQGNLIALETGGHSYYYTLDGQGSVVALTDSTGNTDAALYSYDPYGQTTTSSGPLAGTNPWRYTSGYLDPTGLYKLGARYYDPGRGRFSQPDPATAEGYSYVGGDPVNAVDPSGLFLEELVSIGEKLAEGKT